MTITNIDKLDKQVGLIMVRFIPIRCWKNYEDDVSLPLIMVSWHTIIVPIPAMVMLMVAPNGNRLRFITEVIKTWK